MTEFTTFSERQWQVIGALSLDHREQLEEHSRSLPFVPSRHVATGQSNMFLLYSGQGISAYRPEPHWIAPDHLLAGLAHFQRTRQIHGFYMLITEDALSSFRS